MPSCRPPKTAHLPARTAQNQNKNRESLQLIEIKSEVDAPAIEPYPLDYPWNRLFEARFYIPPLGSFDTNVLGMLRL